MIIPYRLDVPEGKRPYSNYLLIIFMILIFVLENTMPWKKIQPFTLYKWSFQGLVGHIWLHIGYLHLIGNLIFLWVFGNKICSKTGNFLYPLIFLFSGIIAGCVHMLFDGSPVMGSSGVVSSILGICFILYPWNDVKCLFFFIPFKIAAFFIILWWFILDFLFAVIGYKEAAYWGHVGGFLGGIITILVLLKLKLVKRDIYNTSFYRSLW